MWAWYRDAAVCYVYLADLEPGSAADLAAEGPGALAACRWFTRGWTLQELIAPKVVEFFDREWNYRGGRADLAKLLKRITGIPWAVLSVSANLEQFAVAMRMSWAARRETTRGEDMAYCLMGLFDVNMPLLYGEGMVKAFARLQMAIVQSTGDMSIFAWVDDRVPCPQFSGMLAESPRQFATCGDVEMFSGDLVNASFAITSRGIQTDVIQVHNQRHRDGEWRLALHTSCYIEGLAVWVSVQKIGTGLCARRDPGERVMLGSLRMPRPGLRSLDVETLTLATRLPTQNLHNTYVNPALGNRWSALHVNWGPLALDCYRILPQSNWDAHDGVFFSCDASAWAWAVCYLRGAVKSEASGQWVSVDLFLGCYRWGISKEVTVVLASLDNLSAATSTFMRLHLESIKFEDAGAAEDLALGVFKGKLEEKVIDTELGPVRYFKDSARQLGGVEPAVTVVNLRTDMRPDVCFKSVIVLDLSHATR